MRQQPQTANQITLPVSPGRSLSASRQGAFSRHLTRWIAGIGLTTVAASASTFVSGYLNYEYYPNKVRDDVEAGNAGVPATNGTVQGADNSGYVPVFESGTNFADNYANRFFGYFVPPTTGDYVFFVASDDDSDLFLSTDSTAANKKLIAQETAWSPVRSYNSVGDAAASAADKRSDQFGGTQWPNATIHLTAGQKYYIEGVHHEGGGGDNFAVTYKLASEADPANGTPPRLVGSVIGTDVATAPATPTFSITTQPAGGTVYIGGSLNLNVKVATDSQFPVAYQWRKNGSAILGATSPSFSIGAPVLGDSGTYDVQVSVPGATGAPTVITSTAANITVAPSPFVSGFLKYDYFPGSDRPTVEGGGVTPSLAGTTQGSDKSGYVSSFAAGVDFADNYANRISGVFIAPTTGDYVFFIASDDDSDLFLSTDENPANKKLIAQEAGWSGSRNYNTIGGTSTAEAKRSDQFTGTQWGGATIHLTAGSKYYIEAVHHEGGGGDNLAVTYRLATEDEALTADGTASRLTGSVIGISVPPAQQLDVTTQPVNTSVFAGTPATFSVAATTDSAFPIQYQWRKGGVIITNATTPNFSFVTVPSDNASTYDVVLNVPGLSRTSSVASVTVKSGAITVNGKLKHEFWSGKTRQDIENGNVGAPNFVSEYLSWESPVNYADNFAERVSGYFIPPTTGSYVFFVASDDDSDLFLSSDASPATKRLIAQETGWSNNREWTISGSSTDAAYLSQKRSDQFSPDAGVTHPFSGGIALTAGQKYYIEGVHHEGGGGDNFSVTYKLLADADPVNPDTANNIAGDPTKLTNSLIAYASSPVTSGTIATQPKSVNQYEAQAVTFSVAVATDAELTPLYQWRKNGTAIVGATSSSYTIPFLAAGDSGTYDVLVTIPNSTFNLTSSPATLQVLSAPLITGLLKYEYFPGQTRTALEAGTAGSPSTAGYLVGGDQSGYITIFESAIGFADNYANRISGYFIPPVTGDYVFFVAGDDDTDLFLSTDDTPANKKMIAQETGYSGNRLWNTIGATSTVEAKRSDQFATSQWPGATPNGATIHLIAGNLYYIEADHHDGTGGDNLGVTYKLATAADPEDLSASTLKGSVVGVKVIPQPLGSTPPAVTSAIASLGDIKLTFSAPLDAVSGANVGNYNLGTGVSITSASVREVFQGTNIVSIVTLKTSGTTACKSYSVAISNVKDATGNIIAGGTSVPVTTPCLTLDFNSGTLPNGVTTGDTASIESGLGPDGSAALQLTDAVNSLQGAIRIGDLASGATVTNFTVTFKLFIGNGSADAADGMSINFGNIPDTTTSVGEEGTGLLSVDFDTYNNGSTGPGGHPEAPAFDVKLNGITIGWAPLPKAAIVNDQWVDVVIQLNSDNSITAIYNGVTYFNHLPLVGATNLITGAAAPNYAPISNGIFLIGGRTGGEHARQALDDLTIVENAAGGITPPTGNPTLTVSRSGSNLTISWSPSGGSLESSSAIGAGAAWTPVGAQNPTTVQIPATGNRFFRVKQ